MSSRTVTIIVGPGTMTFFPPMVLFNPGDTITWVVDSQNGWAFGAQGIVINTVPNGRYAGWPPENPARPSETNPITWSVTAPPNLLTMNYQYTINLVNQDTG